MVAAAGTRDLKFYNEWHDSQGCLRPHYKGLYDTVMSLGFENLAPRWNSAQRQVDLEGMTFYLDPGQYRNMPTDFLPRMIPLEHWETIAAGVEQRIRAINHFLVGLYNDGQDVVPDEVIYTSQHFYPEVQGFSPPKDVFVHIYGVDLVHMGDGRYVVLEAGPKSPGWGERFRQ